MNETNPVHADMMEACSMVNPAFLVNVVVNDQQEIIAAFAGNWVTAHRAACDWWSGCTASRCGRKRRW